MIARRYVTGYHVRWHLGAWELIARVKGRKIIVIARAVSVRELQNVVRRNTP